MYDTLLRRIPKRRLVRRMQMPTTLSTLQPLVLARQATNNCRPKPRKQPEFNAPRLADLVLIRHGESEGNVARQRSLRGDHSLFYGEFQNRHSCNWRLTDRGREQAAAAGDWLRRNDLIHFDRYLVSEYLRSMETAARLELPDARWYAEMLIRERDWGQMDLMSEQERVVKMHDELRRRDLNRFYYAPPGGESLAAVAQRADRMLGALHRECTDQKVIVVCHGEVMWALRTRLERMSQDTFRELQDSGRMVDQIHNGHILHYTRLNPYTGEMAPFFTHMRSVCPWNAKLSPKGWIKIERPVYDNEMMLAIAERVPRMIVSDEYIDKTYQGQPLPPVVSMAGIAVQDHVEDASKTIPHIPGKELTQMDEHTSSSANPNTSVSPSADESSTTATAIVNESTSSSNPDSGKENGKDKDEDKGDNCSDICNMGIHVIPSEFDKDFLREISSAKPRFSKFIEHVDHIAQLRRDASPTKAMHDAAAAAAAAFAHDEANDSSATPTEPTLAPVFMPVETALNLSKVVIVNKMTRFEHEMTLHGNTGEALRKQMSMRGFVYDRLKASHDHHLEALDDVTSSLQEHGIQVSVVSANKMSQDALDGADMVFSAGGDGTFLKAASFVNRPIPVAGLNTDPGRSEGKLCCFAVDPLLNQFSFALERLLTGNFHWRLRNRIRVGMVNQEGFWYELPRYALNEVFIAESDSSRPSFYNIGIDQHQRETHRSSGIVVCTGTGSSAWYYSASQIHREQVASVLNAMHHSHTNETVTELTETFNKANVFPETSLDMGYVVREPIINETFGDIRFRKGKARRVSMRSLGWDMRVYLDGLYSVPLDYGVQAVMKIVDEPKYVLRTVEFDEAVAKRNASTVKKYWSEG